MKIGIIGAMEQEVAILKNALENRVDRQIANVNFYTGQLSGVEVVLVQSGIGKVSTAIGTTLLIDKFAPDCVINTGSAGGLSPDLDVGDVVISTEVRYHDADVTAFGYEMGQMAQQPAAFLPSSALVELAEQALASMKDVRAVKGLICSGDAFVHRAEQQAWIKQHFPSVCAVEMEAASIAQTCHQLATPFVIVRAISDIADKESPLSFNEFLPLASERSSQMIIKMLTKLAS